MFDIQEELKKLPNKPGVYLMKNQDDKIIYVGKAKNLKNRVRSYFRESAKANLKVSRLVSNIKEFEYIVTDTEMEALILESNLIKEHQPRYNILLKDDKTYPYIKITTNEKYPKVYKIHKHKKDKAKYFGPYTNKGYVNETIEILHDIFKIRTCHKKFPRDFNKERPCLNYHIGKCDAPCTGKVDENEYNEMINKVIEFLNGKHDKILKSLKEEMATYAENLDFEKAAETRDKIQAIEKLDENQKMESESADEQDIIAFARADEEALFQVFYVRNGKMIGRDHFMLKNVIDSPREEIMTEFIKQFYSDSSFIPKEIVLETDIEDKEIISKWLTAVKEKNVTITVPQKGNKHKLIELAHKNAIITLEQFGEKIKRENEKTVGAVKEIQDILGLENEIIRIEAYDISNIQGFESVASMVVFENGKPKRNDYRKFKIKWGEGPNDYQAMEEVITRRFLRYKKELNEDANNQKFSKLPDIIFMDGGKGQITAAKKAMENVNIYVPVCGMVKDDRHRTRGLIFENQEIELKKTSEGFKLITRIQDEVHRFAIEYHRKLREKILVKSVLDDIPTIGEQRRKELIKYFGSVDNIKKASIDELSKVESMNKRSAEEVYNFFVKNP